MALKSIKEVINNRGILLNQKDMQIFQNGKDLKSFFGLSNSDAIEFIIYDVNNNQLPQKTYGNVRYIPLSSENIRDYFLVSDASVFQNGQLPSEYFIDAERLIKEAGYNSGIFRVQITLMNKRVGSDGVGDKLWIQEISRSRTEVRLQPLLKDQTENVKRNLTERFGIFVQNKEFREDVAPLIQSFVEKIDSIKAENFLNTKYSSTNFISRLRTEFKIEDFQKFLTDIRVKFIEAVGYEFSNRNSDINDINYGNPLTTPFRLDLSLKEVDDKCKIILTQCINRYLPLQNIRDKKEESIQQNVSQNALRTISQRRVSDTVVVPTNEVILNVTVKNPSVEVTKDVRFTERVTTVTSTSEVGSGGSSSFGSNNEDDGRISPTVNPNTRV